MIFSQNTLNKGEGMQKEPINVATLDQFKEKYFGKRGTKSREELEAGYEKFRTEAETIVVQIK